MKFVVEINPRTKEKQLIDLLEYELKPDFTIEQLVKEHEMLKKHIKKQDAIIIKLIDVIANLNKSTAVQIADIKEEIK